MLGWDANIGPTQSIKKFILSKFPRINLETYMDRIRSAIKDNDIKPYQDKYIHIQQVESLVQDTKNSLYAGQAISMKLYEKMHALYLYI